MMIHLNHSRLCLIAASVSAALLLSACQPAEEAAVEATPAAIDATAIDAHAGHDMSGNNMAMDGAPMSEMQQAYNDSMTTMHDEMMAGMAYNNPDAAFAQSMLGHHIGAVDMAKIQLKYGSDAEMLKLAQEIIDAQQPEIEQMQNWLTANPDAAAPAPDTQAMQQAYAAGMEAMHKDMMLGIADPNPDMAFARGMLPHHVGAVDMAKIQLKYGSDAEMLKLAQEIIDAQQSEIEQMQNWINANKA